MTTQREAVVRNIVERVLSYALCRKLERHDQPIVDTITENIVDENGTWRSLFIQVASSLPFRETHIDAATSDGNSSNGESSEKAAAEESEEP